MLWVRPCSILKTVFYCIKKFYFMEQEPPVNLSPTNWQQCLGLWDQQEFTAPQDLPQVHTARGGLCVSQRNQTLGNKTTKKRLSGQEGVTKCPKTGKRNQSTRTNQLWSAGTVP